MSAKSYVRVQTPSDLEPGQQSAYQRKFHHDFEAAGGQNGARILKIASDDFNSTSTPLLCALIKGHMTPKQSALVL